MVRKYAMTEDEFLGMHVDSVDGHLKTVRDNGDPVDFGKVSGDVTPEALQAVADAQAAAAAAEAVGNTNDTIMAANVGTGGAFDAKLSATKMERVVNVAAMVAKTFPVGALVATTGYFSPGDGGAGTYRVLASGSKSYDITGAGIAFRLAPGATVVAKQFGTVNDGVSLDNLPLQKAYDFIEDHGILTIDGQGLTYTIGTANAYDTAVSGWAHSGAIVQAGHVIENFTFKTAPGATTGTVAASVRLSSAGAPTRFRNCIFDGNRDAIGSVASGREDGGCHLVHLFHPDVQTVPSGSRDFFTSGNVYFEGCTFKDAWSYGVRIDHIDALVQYTDCVWSVYGIGAQMHATRNVVRGGSVTVGTPRAGMVSSPFHAEIEFAGAYTGTKRPQITIESIKFTHVNAIPLLKLESSPMQGLAFSRIRVADVALTGAGKIFEAANSTSTQYPQSSTLLIDELSIERSPGVSQPAVLLQSGSTTKRVRTAKFDMPGKAAADQIRIAGEIGTLTLSAPAFAGDGNIRMVSATIDLLRIIGATNAATGTYGLLRDAVTSANSTVKVLDLRDSELTNFQGDAALFDAVFQDVRASQVTLNTQRTDGFHYRLFHLRGAAGRVRMKGVLLTGASDTVSSNGRQLVYADSTVVDGLVYMDDVRHLTVSTPTVSAQGLPAGRIVLSNVTPLY